MGDRGYYLECDGGLFELGVSGQHDKLRFGGVEIHFPHVEPGASCSNACFEFLDSKWNLSGASPVTKVISKL